jgi:two-component system, response regulator
VTGPAKKLSFIITEDDDDDFLVIEKSFQKVGFKEHDLIRVTDGESLLRILRAYEEEKKTTGNTWPVIILLDLNMPKMDGRQALTQIKSDPQLKMIPIMVFTTSKAIEDIQYCYSLGANAYFIKPSSFNEFQEMIQTIGQHWLKTAALPTL